MAPHRPASLLPTWRHSSNPFVSSPLHNVSASKASIAGPGSPLPETTPSRASRSRQQHTRSRTESRSSSVPSGLNVSRQPSQPILLADADLTARKNSVKHLTCFWWKERGQCRFSDEECLYAHRDTGRYTDPPRQVIPGKPAKAGRSLDRALRNLALSGSHRSSPSLFSLPVSRPETPGLEMVRNATPSPRAFDAMAHLHAENTFLRTLVEHSSREKAVLADTIERLASENDDIKAQVEVLKTRTERLQLEAQQLIEERDTLKHGVHQYQPPQRRASNPYGAIGSNRLGQQSRPGSHHMHMFPRGDSKDLSLTKESFAS